MAEEKGGAESPGQKASGRVLVVDDENMVRRLAKTMLTRLGYEVVDVSSGAEAIEAFRKADAPFDLVLLDMIMPGMDGRDCFMALKSINPDVRAVISSGFSQEDATQELMQEGVRGFVQKPYRLTELSEVVSKALAD